MNGISRSPATGSGCIHAAAAISNAETPNSQPQIAHGPKRSISIPTALDPITNAAEASPRASP